MNIIRNVVGRLHVGTPDREVVDYVISRLKKGAWEALTPQQQQHLVVTALEEHHENIDLYRSVMGGAL